MPLLISLFFGCGDRSEGEFLPGSRSCHARRPGRFPGGRSRCDRKETLTGWEQPTGAIGENGEFTVYTRGHEGARAERIG